MSDRKEEREEPGGQKGSRPSQALGFLPSHSIPPPPSRDPQDEQDTTVLSLVGFQLESILSLFPGFDLLFFPKPLLNK